MYYGEIKKTDIANGNGIRVSLFVSGCTHRCKGCFNPETWDFSHGQPFTPRTEEMLLQALQPSYINGLTLLGGDPMEPFNQRALIPFLIQVREQYPQKDIWCYTGAIFGRDLSPGGSYYCEVTDAFLNTLDVLVDGPFIEAKKDLSLRFRGSSNQRIIDMARTRENGKVTLWDD